jgi:hypothetical protein
MCVKFLLILHNELPSEPLAGFRSRFLKLYTELKQFYSQCLNIHFLRQIVSIPKMPASPPDFHSTVPDINEHHKQLQQATVVEQRPPSPTEPEIETETLIDISSDLESLNVHEFQESGQLDQLRRQVEQLNFELSEAKREQIVEATKLLEHITNIEHEKSNMAIEIEGLRKNNLRETQLTSSIQITELEEQIKNSENRASNVENGYKQLKEKHLKLVDAHAKLLRSAQQEKEAIKAEHVTQINKAEAELEGIKCSILNYVIEQSGELIEKKKSEIGIESIEQRIENLKNKTNYINQQMTHNDSQIQFPVQLAILSTQLIDIAAESAQKDGNLINSSLGVLESSETVLNTLLVENNNFNSKIIIDSLNSLESEIRKLKDDVIEVPSAIIETELSVAQQMVSAAAARIKEILEQARNQMKGKELKVHEDILDNCNKLMDFILQLIQQSDILQNEIVEN